MSSMVTIRMRRADADSMRSLLEHAQPAFSREVIRQHLLFVFNQALASALKPKPSRHVTKSARKAKRETKREETARIRAAVFARADGRCEGPHHLFAVPNPERCRLDVSEMHHVFGRIAVRQASTNCAALCGMCHHSTTRYSPSAEFWWRWWSEHFERLGYTEEARRARALLHKHEVKAQLGVKP